MGLADLMYATFGVRYGSEAALDFCGQIMEYIRYYSMLTSIQLAEQRALSRKRQYLRPRKSQVAGSHPAQALHQRLGTPSHRLGRYHPGHPPARHSQRRPNHHRAHAGTAIGTVAGIELRLREPVFARSLYAPCGRPR